MTQAQMQVALQALPPLQVACLVLAKRDHMTNEQIAEALGITHEQVHQAQVAGILYLVRFDQIVRGMR